MKHYAIGNSGKKRYPVSKSSTGKGAKKAHIRKMYKTGGVQLW